LRRLKRVDTTRWSSHSSALDTVLDTYDSIIDTLNFIQNDLTTDRVCSVKASSLINYMLSERFVLIALTFKKIFNITHPFTKFLQGKDIDLLGAINYTQSIFIQIQILRSDESLKNIINDKDNFINSKLNDFSFTSLEISRVKKIKRMPGEIAADEQLNSPIDNFRIKTYYSIIDIVITQITERFNEDSTPLFKDLSLFQIKRLHEVAENASSLPIDAFDGLLMCMRNFLMPLI